MARGFEIVARGSGDLKTRYRPQRLNEAAPTFPIRRLKKIITDPNASQVYMFEGLTGTGKTSCARIIARACICEGDGELPCLECEACLTLERSPDFFEINVANFRKIDDVRQIIDGMHVSMGFLKRKIYIFDEVHQLTTASQQLLLKALEEPPTGVIVFLCTTEKTGLIRTLTDRAVHIKFNRLQKAHATKIIDKVLEDAGEAAPEIDDNTRLDMFRRADGSVRALMNLLQAFLDGDYETGETETEGVTADVRELAKALMSKNWQAASEILKAPGSKKAPEGLRIGVTSYVRAICLNHNNIDLTASFVLSQLSGTLADQPAVEQYNQLVLRCMRACYKK